VNIADAVAVLTWLFVDPSTVTCPDAADANDDEQANVADAVYILQWLFINGPQPPPPFPIPDCGPDTTGHADPGRDDLPPCVYAGC
jgi:hypothetical protein